MSMNRVTPLCPCHPPVGYSPFYPTTHHHRSATALLVAVLGREKEQPKGCSFFISGGISAPCRRANGAETAESSGRGTSVPALLLIAGISSAERVPCFSSGSRPLPEQGLYPAAEHGVLRLGQQRVAGQQLLRGIPASASRGISR